MSNSKHCKSGDGQSFLAREGDDKFGKIAERFAIAFGSPRFIFFQLVFVIVWIALNMVLALLWHSGWDPYPFILLNLAFSTEAAFAAPIILLAQTRQAEREYRREVADDAHREKLDLDLAEKTGEIHQLLTQVHEVSMELDEFMEDVHNRVVREDAWRKDDSYND